MFKDSHDGLDALNKRLLAECNGLKSLMSKPLSVYFTAYRAEDYIEGGEAYLTFQGIKYLMLDSILKQELNVPQVYQILNIYCYTYNFRNAL